MIRKERMNTSMIFFAILTLKYGNGAVFYEPNTKSNNTEYPNHCFSKFSNKHYEVGVHQVEGSCLQIVCTEAFEIRGAR